MKKSRVLSTPTPIHELSFDEFYEEDGKASLKAERINIQKWRQFKRESSA